MGLAERLQSAIERAREREERGEVLEQGWSPIYIAPGKEITVRGRLAARMNAARARMLYAWKQTSEGSHEAG